MSYNWQQPDWPEFYYDLSGIEEALFKIAEKTGQASGLLNQLTADSQLEATIEMMVVEALRRHVLNPEESGYRDRPSH
jgi:Fic family protein